MLIRMVESILAVIQSHSPDIEFVVLFGSHAKNLATAKSDVDLAIHSKRPIPPEEQVLLCQKLESKLKKKVDLVDLATCGPTVKFESLTQGKVILNLNPMAYARLMKEFLFDREDWGRSRSFIRSETRKKIFGKD